MGRKAGGGFGMGHIVKALYSLIKMWTYLVKHVVAGGALS